MQDLDRNKETIRFLYESVLSAQAELPPELFAPEFPGGAEGFRALVAGLNSAFPDIRYTVLSLIAEGDRVAVRWQWTGTHRGPFRNFAATHATVINGGMAVCTFSGGLISGIEIQTDRLGFLQQIGAAPADVTPSVSPPVLDTRRAPTAVYLLDTFLVPAAVRDEFEAAMRRNRELIRSLDGFRGDAVLVRKQGESFDIATIAVWESPAAIAHAKEEVAAFYQRIGFDMPATIARWGVTLQRTICEAPAGLQ